MRTQARAEFDKKLAEWEQKAAAAGRAGHPSRRASRGGTIR